MIAASLTFFRIFVDHHHLDNIDTADSIHDTIRSAPATQRKNQVQDCTGSDAEIACRLIVRPAQRR